MIRRRTVRPAAQADIDEKVEYLASAAGEHVALRFLAEIETTLASLGRMPAAGAPLNLPHPKLQHIRKQPVAGFPSYLLLYQHDCCSIELLHLYHGREDIELRLLAEADDDDYPAELGGEPDD